MRCGFLSLKSNSLQDLRENKAAWEKRKWTRDCVFNGSIHFPVRMNAVLSACVRERESEREKVYRYVLKIFFVFVSKCIAIFVPCNTFHISFM